MHMYLEKGKFYVRTHTHSDKQHCYTDTQKYSVWWWCVRCSVSHHSSFCGRLILVVGRKRNCGCADPSGRRLGVRAQVPQGWRSGRCGHG